MKLLYAATRKEIDTRNFAQPKPTNEREYLVIEARIAARTTGEVVEIVEDGYEK